MNKQWFDPGKGARPLRILGLLLAAAVLLAGCSPSPSAPATVSPAQAAAALAQAEAKLGAPYVFGGRGPDEFDCSGLITWSYKQAVPGIRFEQPDGTLYDDAVVLTLYRSSTVPVATDAAVPGDLVFLTDGTAEATHGGLFIGWVDAENLEFINASSYFGEVAIDTWPATGVKRGQWLAGIGRLKMRE